MSRAASIFARLACLAFSAGMACSLFAASPAVPDRAAVEFFEARVRPVLATNCYKCHSATSEKPKGHLRVDSREALLKGGDSGPAVVPGNPGKSLLIRAVDHDPSGELEMPPKTKLSAAAIADLTRWVQQGAPWPAEPPPAAVAVVDKAAEFNQIRDRHWAFQPLVRPPAPQVRDAAWLRTPIDAFVLQKLEAKRIQPAPSADRRTLLRRVYLDLVGLPPTPAEQQAFFADASPNAFERVVDDLLARPQYGERWGRHWLDVARYAESQGYERDDPKPFAWRYRDYVINALNADKPFDRFLTEQLAGDEMSGSNAETQTATGFLRVGAFDTIAADGRLARYDQLDDVVGTTASAFLGQTVRCARCHDHKFEPFAQADYYKLLAVFEPLNGKAKEATLVGNAAELKAFHEGQAKVDVELAPVQTQLDRLRLALINSADPAPGTPPKEKPPVGKDVLAAIIKPPALRTKQDLDVLTRARKRLDEEASRRATPEQKLELQRLGHLADEISAKRPAGKLAYVFTEEGVKPPVTRLFYRGDHNKPGPEVPVGVPTALGGDGLPPPMPTSHTSGRRLWLANWMTGTGAPLVARVIANRVWQYHFGVGIVATSNDFGVHGDPPTHPELLNWLAADLIEHGWSLKHLHRTIVLSAVYQTTSAHSRQAADPDNQLLAHWRTRRLESEAVRDSVLAVSGRLNPEMFGPSVFPPLAQKVVGDSAGFEWVTSDESQASRRSVYVYVKRNVAVPELEVLGIADATTSTDRRAVATTALQSLMLLNSKFTNQQAAAFAERVRRDGADGPESQVRRAFEIALCRLPRPEELVASMNFLSDQARFGSIAGTASPSFSPLASLCLVLLNTNEFLYIN